MLSTFFLFFLFFFFLFSSLFLSFLPPLFPPPLFCKYGYKRGFGCFNLLLCPSAPTSLGILETVSFKMSWVLKCTWSLWVTSRRSTFSESWNSDISQGNLESFKEFLMMRVPSTPQCSQIGSWAGLVKIDP